jgi:hypothetical protein
VDFEWDQEKNVENIEKHGVSFSDASLAWQDPNRVSSKDRKHSKPGEERSFLFGWVRGGVLTVRFTRKGNTIRIIGAGYWRAGKDKYEQANRFRR